MAAAAIATTSEGDRVGRRGGAGGSGCGRIDVFKVRGVARGSGGGEGHWG